jgi:hypothetical protein
MDMANGAEPHSASGHKADGFEQDSDLDGGWDDEPAPASIARAPVASAKSSSAPSVAPYRPSVGAPAPASLSALVAEVAAKSPKPPSVAQKPVMLSTPKAPSVAPALAKAPSVAPRPIALTTQKASSVAPKPYPTATPGLPMAGERKAPSPTLTPVSAVPRPRSYGPPPPAAQPVKSAASATVEKPVTAAVSAPAAAPLSPKSAPVQAPPAEAARAFAALTEDTSTLRPNEVDPPVASKRRRGVARFVASLGIAAAMVLASLAWLKDGGQTVTSQISRVLARAAQPQPEPAARPTPPEPPAPESKSADSSLLPGAVITAVEPAPAVPEAALAPPPPTALTETPSAPAGALALAKPGSTRVTVKTVPSGAAIFQAGKRLGAGLVELDVEPNMKRRLTVLMDGHRPVNFTVDGSRDTVTIMLKPVPRVVPSKPEASTASGGSSEVTPEKPAEAAPAATTEGAKPADPFAAP